MSVLERQALVKSGHIFADTSQWPNAIADLLDPTMSQTELIEGLAYLGPTKGYHLQLTAVYRDHTRIDGPRGHNPGRFAADLWVLTGPQLNAWLAADDPMFAEFLKDAAAWIGDVGKTYQIGLAGSAKNAQNWAAIASLGANGFDDDDEDHVHLGTQPRAGW